MNAKSEIIEMLKKWVSYYENYNERYPYASQEYSKKQIEYYGNLIAATESAIFGVPSEEEIKEAMKSNYALYGMGFGDGINFIMNFKNKTE